LVAWIRSLREGASLAAFATGLLIGCLVLVRPVAALFWVGPVLTLLLARGKWNRRVAQAALVLAGYAIVVGPWSLRNARVGAGFAPSSMADSQIVEWQAAIIESRARRLPRAEVAAEYANRYPPHASGLPVLLDVAQRFPRALVSSTAAS